MAALPRSRLETEDPDQVLQGCQHNVPGRPEQVAVAVRDRQDGTHTLQVLSGQHDRALLGGGRQGGSGQGGAHGHHLVPVVPIHHGAALAFGATLARRPGHQLGARGCFQHAKKLTVSNLKSNRLSFKETLLNETNFQLI